MHFWVSVLLKYFFRKKQHAAFHEGIIHDNIVIVGANSSSIDFYNTLNEHYYYGYKCLGFLDENLVSIDGCKYFGKPDKLAELLNNEPIDEVIISLPQTEQESIRQSIEVCDQKHVKVRIMPELFHLTSKSAKIDNIGMVSVINLNDLPLDNKFNKLIKEIFDKIFSILFFLIIGWWLFPVIIILIKLDSKGPAIYKQERWGFNNKHIVCYKFRTMIMPLLTDPFEQTSKDDPRVTRIGKWLRMSSIDELPQFWNVVMGEMSIVGPRPHPTPMNIESMNNVQNYLKRHLVKPGITGWAQINGCRGEVRTIKDMTRRVNLDLYYIHRWSMTLDLQITLQTIIKLIRGDKDAY
jgi:putative colanic acid biosynthesis UDP-glucose lipid carrier transferase